MTDPDAEVWRYTFAPGPDFTLKVRGQIIDRVLRTDVTPAGPIWERLINCVRQFVGMTKPGKIQSGNVDTKPEAIKALRAAWALERDWRAEMRAFTPYHDAGMTHWVGLTAWEGYERQSEAEMPAMREFGRELALDAMKPWEIYQAVYQEIELSEANRDERMAGLQRRAASETESHTAAQTCGSSIHSAGLCANDTIV